MLLLEATLAVAAIGLFGAASVWAVVCLLRPHPPARGKLGAPLLLALGCAPLLAVLVLHGARAGYVPLFNTFDVLTVYGVFLTLAALGVLSRHRTQGVLAILAPYVTLLLITGFPAVGVTTGPVPHQVPNAVLLLHLLVAFAGYALFSLASILAFAYLVQDRNFKRRHFGVVFERLPALETLDHMMFRLVEFAFLLLTISLGLGIYLVHESGSGVEWITDPKVVATLVTWVLYAMLVHMRANAGRHGTRLAIITLVGLAFVLFSMIGVHLIAHSVHGFVQIGSISK
ncbi:MAG: cytochrome c biogenesis protein CcsA [Kiritimatiellaeota bacterium]|nr:cytochrome c biogenesis protein CcsA [Kiritimatiellota bacterium]